MSDRRAGVAEHVRIAIIGSGFAGLGIAIGLQAAGIEDFVVLERADGVGGTWRDNTYPGCACDVPSHLYSLSFAVVEVRSQPQAAYNARVQAATRGSVWTGGGCKSWHLGADGRNRLLRPGFSWQFRRATRRSDPREYAFR